VAGKSVWSGKARSTLHRLRVWARWREDLKKPRWNPNHAKCPRPSTKTSLGETDLSSALMGKKPELQLPVSSGEKRQFVEGSWMFDLQGITFRAYQSCIATGSGKSGGRDGPGKDIGSCMEKFQLIETCRASNENFYFPVAKRRNC